MTTASPGNRLPEKISQIPFIRQHFPQTQEAPQLLPVSAALFSVLSAHAYGWGWGGGSGVMMGRGH